MMKVEGTIGALASMMETNTANRMAALVSRRPIFFSVTRAEAPRTAASTVSRWPRPRVAKSGRIMIKTPANPATCADHRRQPTSSRSRRTESTVTRIGAANRMA
jgi:hypothetical protein